MVVINRGYFSIILNDLNNFSPSKLRAILYQLKGKVVNPTLLIIITNKK